jgi:hypothetical protein
MATHLLSEPYIRTPNGIRLLAHKSVGIDNAIDVDYKPQQYNWPQQSPKEINDDVWDMFKPNKNITDY